MIFLVQDGLKMRWNWISRHWFISYAYEKLKENV